MIKIVSFSSRVMAFWPTDRRQSLSSLYEKIYKEDDSENLWASLLKGRNENHGIQFILYKPQFQK